MSGFGQDKQKDVFPASERIAPTRALGGDAASGDVASGDADRADSSGESVVEPAAPKRSERPVIIGALCAALVVVVVACVFAFGSPNPTVDATASSSSASQEQGAVSGSAAEEDDAQNEDTSDEESADHEAADESGEPTGEDGGASSGAASSYEGTTEPSTSSPSSAGGSGGSGGSGTAPSAAAAPEPEPEPEPTPAPATITVSVYIDSSRAHAYDSSWPSSMGGGTVTLAQGSSVYDALCAVGISVGGSSSYVSSIGGLAEFSCGRGSGWMYSVNGVYPNKSCGKYQLSGGESILWVYTCDLGNDL